MNRSFLCALLITLPTIIMPQMDCLSTTQNLKEPYDHKDYHVVACNCPCAQYRAQGLQSADRDQCLQCKHYHYPRPFIFLSKANAAPTPLWDRWNKHPKLLIQKLIQRYTKVASLS